jgi:hypothetical protein
MPNRRFPPPWSVCFVVTDSAGQKLFPRADKTRQDESKAVGCVPPTALLFVALP